jgi:DNA-binding transcriptional regulator YhcF (GntR family)
MEFNSKKAIFQQIADLVCEHILSGKWKEEERIPSVRELASTLEVNPNTIIKSYEELQSKEIIYNKRGLGYFVTTHSLNKIKENFKNEFISKELPQIYKQMIMIGFTTEDFTKGYNDFIINKK